MYLVEFLPTWALHHHSCPAPWTNYPTRISLAPTVEMQWRLEWPDYIIFMYLLEFVETSKALQRLEIKTQERMRLWSWAKPRMFQHILSFESFVWFGEHFWNDIFGLIRDSLEFGNYIIVIHFNCWMWILPSWLNLEFRDQCCRRRVALPREEYTGWHLLTKYRKIHHIFPPALPERYSRASYWWSVYTVPAFVFITTLSCYLVVWVSKKIIDNPKSMTLIWLSSALVRSKKFSGFIHP